MENKLIEELIQFRYGSELGEKDAIIRKLELEIMAEKDKKVYYERTIYDPGSYLFFLKKNGGKYIEISEDALTSQIKTLKELEDTYSMQIARTAMKIYKYNNLSFIEKLKQGFKLN